MATKQQILTKITELLEDINNQYKGLVDETGTQDDLKGDLFEATGNYFAAHAALYNKLVKNDKTDLPSEADDEVFFTPPRDTATEKTVHQAQLEEVETDDVATEDDESAETETEETETEETETEETETEET